MSKILTWRETKWVIFVWSVCAPYIMSCVALLLSHGSNVISGICRTSNQPDQCGTRLLKVGPNAGPEPRCVRHSKKCLGPSRHSPKMGSLRRYAISLTAPRMIKAKENKGMSSDKTQPIRSVPLTARPAEVCLINWLKSASNIFSDRHELFPWTFQPLNFLAIHAVPVDNWSICKILIPREI